MVTQVWLESGMVYRQWLTVKTRTFITTPICHLRRWLAALPFEESWGGWTVCWNLVFIVDTFLASSLEFRVKRSRDKHFSECSLDQLSQKYNLTPNWSCRMSRIKLETSHLPGTQVPVIWKSYRGEQGSAYPGLRTETEPRDCSSETDVEFWWKATEFVNLISLVFALPVYSIQVSYLFDCLKC